MFVDEVEVSVESGKGGDGMVHFRREKYIPRGGPDGGDGGKGGDVVLEVRPTLNTLSAFRPRQKFMARPGEAGGSSQKSGKKGEDLIIAVPPGTVAYLVPGGEIVGDLTVPGQRLIVCKGGRGGRGNQHFATSRNQAPRTAERGEPSEAKRLRLELKLIADIGIVGLPNAGKSTLLGALTNATPKIAAYPFTTLHPNLGVASVDADTAVVLADIPGLIEGAHEGAGLGQDFLRHIQRTRVLIHLLDGLSADPLADFTQINSELALFDPRLASKPQVVALNKMDEPEASAKLASATKAFELRGVRLLGISALRRTQTRELLLRAAGELHNAPAMAEVESSVPIYRSRADASDFKIKREDGDLWRVSGAGIERAAAMTYFQHDGSLRRFQRLMAKLGVDEQLRRAGIQPGDTVAIGEHELEWQD